MRPLMRCCATGLAIGSIPVPTRLVCARVAHLFFFEDDAAYDEIERLGRATPSVTCHFDPVKPRLDGVQLCTQDRLHLLREGVVVGQRPLTFKFVANALLDCTPPLAWSLRFTSRTCQSPERSGPTGEDNGK